MAEDKVFMDTNVFTGIVNDIKMQLTIWCFLIAHLIVRTVLRNFPPEYSD
jgi:hypothetical protein